MWVVWLIFLVFPVLAVWRDPTLGTASRAAGLTLIAAFAVTYTLGALRLMRFEEGRLRPTLLFLGALLVLALLSLPILGSNVVSFTPFLVSYAAFSLPRPWHWVFALVTVAIAVIALLLTGHFEQWFSFLFILIAIAVGVNAARFLAEQSEEYDVVRQDLAITAERERVARDVHDVLGHSLTVVSVKAGLAERLIDVDPERARAEIAEIGRIARESLGEVRATVGGLRAAALAGELDEARAALASAGIESVVDGAPADVDPTHRGVLGWVLREAVTNVVRHSRAGRCRIRLAPHALAVEDDGVGLTGRRPGHGLRGLEERVTEAGATFTLGPGPHGRGTRLEVSWPT